MSVAPTAPRKIAVVGCGVAGLTAAWLLNREHEVHLFERNDYFGGHTRTLTVPDGPDAGTPVDTGFIVMNHRNYPLLTEVLKQLEVPLADSSMTFSFTDEQTGYSYAGNSFGSLFPSIAHWLNARHWRMLKSIRRFATVGYDDLMSGRLTDKTLGEYLSERGYSREFVDQYLLPMGAAIWSSPLERMLEFPAEPYLHFLENHGLLRLTNRPQWRYIPGGSRSYVRPMLDSLGERAHLNAAPQSISRQNGKIQLRTKTDAILEFDQVVIGAHADEALQLLADADDAERSLLGAWRYQDNEVVLHTHSEVLPPKRRLWASWNFTREPGLADNAPVSVTYHMNRLQRLKTHRDYFVTLNRQQAIPEATIINRTTLTHPQYDFDSLATQSRLGELNGTRNTWFCGSYFGYGFHEDAVRSAVEVARGIGVQL